MSLWRFKSIVFIFSLFFVLVVIRLFYWQVLQTDKLQTLATSQYFLQEEIPASRGQILTSDGFPLISNTAAYLLYAIIPEIDQSPQNIMTKIANSLKKERKIGSEEEASLKSRLESENLIWVPLLRKLKLSEKAAVESLGIKGLGFEEESTRDYPEGSMAAHLVGFVGKDVSGQDTGYFGLEGFYNRELTGKPGIIRTEKDAMGKPIIIGKRTKEEQIPGRDLELYLDRDIQFMVENRLKEGLDTYKAKSGSVVVMDPATGGIIAMASFPSYAPANFNDFNKSYFPNPVVADGFEPGSIFKVLVMAGAINEKAVSPDERCPKCSEARVIGEDVIKTWNDKYHPDESMSDILLYSDNVGMVYVGEKLGKEKLLKTIRNFGMGELTGIDLEEESSPRLKADNQWYPIDLATISFGQGIAVTPIQMVTAVSAIANRGNLLTPQVVHKIISPEKTIEIKPKIKRRVISPTTAKVVTEMMVNAVEKGEAAGFKVPGYRIAGKTGTAQIPIAGHYDDKKTIASFVGFAPADKPKFVMLVSLQEPTSSQWGSRTAAPLWFEIARDIFLRWKIPPQ